MKAFQLFLCLAILAARQNIPAQESPPFTPGFIINPDGPAYDSEISVSTDGEGTFWNAWHSYFEGKEIIHARKIKGGVSDLLQTVQEKGTIHSSPHILAHGDSVWVVWSSKLNDRWQIIGREMRKLKWQASEILSEIKLDSIDPTLTLTADGKLLAAWSSSDHGNFVIQSRLLDQGKWGEITTLSHPTENAFRPEAITHGNDSWIVWDQYHQRQYSIRARNVYPQLTSEQRISPDDENCLTPAVLSTSSGLHVAWVRATDVIGGAGAISQMHSAHLATLTDGKWSLTKNEDGSTAGAEFTHGLMSKIDPKAVATGGYTGRRRTPMLAANGDEVWLLWERKSNHRGSTPLVTGDLIGKPVSKGQWGKPVILHQGLVDYHLPHQARFTNGKLELIASQLPAKHRRLYQTLKIDLNDTKPFEQDEWTGWKPLSLPDQEPRLRHEIKIEGKIYQLFWADLHCHSNLTADAEGEPDELLFYARDKAGIDFVTYTENDFLYDTPLTESEYQLGGLFAKCFRNDTFLVLPGYEWTARWPSKKGVDPAGPIHWTPQQNRATYPNHRSVIYPASGGPLIRYSDVKNDISKLYEAIEEAGGVAHTQHGVWNHTGHKVEANVEVTAGWETYINKPGKIHETLDAGYRFGFIGTGDSHRRNPGLCGGLTGVYAESLSSDDIMRALKAHRVFATNGSRIMIDSRAGGIFMGQDTPSKDGKGNIVLRAIGTRPIIMATLYGDGKEIKTYMGNGKKLNVNHRIRGLKKGTHWYYWRIVQEGSSPQYPGNVKVARGNLAWSSPHWVVVE